MSDQTAIQKVNGYFENPIVRARFEEVLDRNAGSYIAGVLLAVANSDNLQKCQPQSIYTSALRAATLRLSVDPATKQAYLVPYGDKATLIVGYKGLYDMAIRTGRYSRIDVYKMYEGETVEEDRITGQLAITGGRTGNRVSGWLGIFQMTRQFGGVSHFLYMTVEEIHAHAQKYSKGYDNPKGVWKSNPEAMEHKTVLRLLLSKWGYLDPVDAATLAEIEEDAQEPAADGEVIEGETVEGQTEQEPEQPKPTEAEVLGQLGFM